MKSTRWFALSAVGALLAVSAVGCGSGDKGGSKTTGAGGTHGTAGAGGSAAGQGGTSGAAGQAGAGGAAGQAGAGGAGGGQAGAGAGGFAFDGGFNFDGGTNFDAIIADILGNLGDGRGVDATGFKLPACASGVKNGDPCVANDKPCKPATGQGCICTSSRNNDRAWFCF
jgi:hypothetical protein